jgi:hypothetical protein
LSIEPGEYLVLVLAPNVRIIADQDGAIVLDIKRNATFGLNVTTTYIWRKLENRLPVAEIIKELALETQEDTAVVEADVLEFIQELKTKKLIVAGDSLWDRKRAVRRALLLFTLYDFLVPPVSFLRRRSLWVIHLAMTWCPTAAIPAPAERATEICEAVDSACSWYPKQVRCLQRSFATTILLRRAGVDAKFVAAAQKLPFQAHAWVEIDETVINDKPEYVNRFIVFERC